MPDEGLTEQDGEQLMLSALNQYLYCPRRCGLIHIEGIFTENALTLEGQLRHEAADTPGYETLPGVRVLRALPLYSLALGLTGRADIVEFRNGIPHPVEYKRGKKKQWDNDDVQLCAQALCLEEMFSVSISKGWVFHATSKKRREVIFAAPLRSKTIETIQAVKDLIASKQVPPAELRPQCDGCSLHAACLPELNLAAAERATTHLFQPED